MSHFYENINYIIIFLMFFKYIISNNKVYKIPFGLYNTKTVNDSLDTIYDIYYNSIYSNLSIGTPPQTVPFLLNINSQTFSVPNALFNKNKSSSYESNSKNEISYQYEDVSDGFNSRDILNINNNTKKKVSFILGTKYQNPNNKLGIIGLLIPKRVQFGVSPFFRSLKVSGLLDSYTWTLKFFDNISLIDTVLYNEEKNNKVIGEFIIGDEPYNYEDDKDKYNKNEFYKVSPLSTKGTIYWDIEFNSIYLILKDGEINESSKFNIQGSKKAQIIPEMGFMVGPDEFFQSIKNNFFQKYFRKNICTEKKIKNNELYRFNYIECNYTSSFKVSSFPNIGFQHYGFETIFNFTYKDLFIVDKKNGKYIFLIFNKEYFPNWVLGSIFLRKYQLVFNEDIKTIGYYKAKNYFSNDDDNNRNNIINNEENKSGTGKYIIIIILIIIFSFLFIIIGMYFQRKFFGNNRKIRANELEENFSYESKFNDDKNIDKNKRITNEDANEKYHSI